MIDSAREAAAQTDIDDLIRGVNVFHARPDRSDFPTRWPGPVDVVAGEFDQAPTLAVQRSGGWMNSRFHEVDGVGHYVPLGGNGLIVGNAE